MIQASFLDYPSNDTVCVSVYLSGCDNNCKGCHNYSLQSHNVINYEILISGILSLCQRLKTIDVCLLGGDPLFDLNIDVTNRLLKDLEVNFNVCIYTGKDVEYARSVLNNRFKYLKTGKYIESCKQDSVKTDDKFVLASSNQCLYDANYNLLTENGIYYFNAEVC